MEHFKHVSALIEKMLSTPDQASIIAYELSAGLQDMENKYNGIVEENTGLKERIAGLQSSNVELFSKLQAKANTTDDGDADLVTEDDTDGPDPDEALRALVMEE